MKTLKIVVGIVVVLVLIAAIGTAFVFKNLDGIAARTIEEVGSSVTGTDVKVERITLQLRKGRGEISELEIANPAGFSNAQALRLGTIALQIDPQSLREDVIVLTDVLVDGAKLRVEHQNLTQTNLKALLDHMRDSLSSPDQGSPQEEPGKERRFMVEDLRFTNFSLDLVSDQFDSRTLQMKDIIRNNLGSRERGLTPKELALAVTQPILEEGKEKVEEELKQRAGDKLQDVVNERLSEEDKARVERLRSLVK